jgi:hypothetical protein
VTLIRLTGGWVYGSTGRVPESRQGRILIVRFGAQPLSRRRRFSWMPLQSFFTTRNFFFFSGSLSYPFSPHATFFSFLGALAILFHHTQLFFSFLGALAILFHHTQLFFLFWEP